MKKGLSLFLSFIMVFGVFINVPVTVNAASVDVLTFELSDDGTMYQVKKCAKNAIGDIVIPDTYNGLPVTKIAYGAFYSCRYISSVSIPKSVTYIGDSAFSSCNELEAVYISDIASWCEINFVSYDGYESNPLYYAEKLYLNNVLVTDLVIPDGVKKISNYAFFNCTSLTSVIIPDSVKSIGDSAFRGCTNLTSVTIPDSVTSIGIAAFCKCTSLTSVTIPDGVTIIGDATFSTCTSLTSVKIPDSVTSVEMDAFYGCTSLTSVEIPDGVTSIGYEAFCKCTSLTSVEIPEGVTSIGESAFEDCSSLISITIPNSVTNIGRFAFGYKYSSWEESFVKIDGFTIYGYIGSAAEKYANDKGFTFIGTCGHSSTKWVTDKNATCTTTGSKHKECTYCKEILETQTIPQTGHTSSNWIIDKKATVNAKGSKHKECTECGEILETAEIPQLKCSKPKLKTISNTEYGVKITWGKVSGADKYYVYRKTSSGSYSRIGSTTKTYYTDKTAKSGKKYYYIVKAINEAGSSSSSSSKSIYHLADTTLSTPKSTKSGITLKWKKVTGADGYMVYRKTGTGSYTKIATVKGSSKVTYTDKSAKKGKKYTYKVKAYKSKTYSAYSNTKTITDKY